MPGPFLNGLRTECLPTRDKQPLISVVRPVEE